jgi:serine/threonine protein kinase
MSIPASKFPGVCRYFAPESFKNSPDLKSEVFSFGLILCELLTEIPPFPPDWSRLRVVKRIAIDGFRPDIPGWIAPNVTISLSIVWHKTRMIDRLSN